MMGEGDGRLELEGGVRERGKRVLVNSFETNVL